jgi:Homing endonuclease associated repeat/HNH endonuclease
MDQRQYRLSRVSGQPVTDEELINDLLRVAKECNVPSVSQPLYRKEGVFDETTIGRRFGTWNKALEKAGLTFSNEVNISDERLFENLLSLWQYYGRQPRRSELAKDPSTLSQSPYLRRFSSWTSALQAFVEYANKSGSDVPEEKIDDVARRVNGRLPSLRLRWKILQRDRFTCCSCGDSPAFKPGVILHVDHIIPWSRGGETVFENLKTLCSSCNLGKSNLMQ